MGIVTDQKGNVFTEFLPIQEQELEGFDFDAPLTHALLVVRYEGKYLMMFNKWSQYWELPGGVIEAGESARECAIRELYEETNQIVSDLTFKGLMKFDLQPSFHGPERTEYGALFYAELGAPRDFVENDEAAKIIWWDGRSEIGDIDEIDRKLLEFT
ncbi:NUDIX domain-containing protein [Paenibacillus albus]|nr:NUDIX hydrolase [Paenibacillus albus]